MFEIENTRVDRTKITPDFADITVRGSVIAVGRLLGPRPLSSLPLEIQLAISESCCGSLFSSLLTVCKVSSELLSLIKHNRSHQIVKRESNGLVNALYGRSTTVFGKSYLSLVSCNGIEENDTKDQRLIW
jgi:hypothetical protein